MKAQRTLRAALLALSLTALVSAPALAQYRYDRNNYDRNNSSFSFSLDIGNQPHWQRVSGTRVMVLRENPGYDVFRYGGDYYAYRYGRWYVADDWRSDFQYISTSSVPYEFRRVPRRHWRQYPRWRDYDRYDRGYYDRNDRWNDNNNNNDRYNHN